MKKLPPGFDRPLYALLLSGAMSFLVTSMAVFHSVGWVNGLLGLYVQSWLPAWAVAFLAVLILAPGVRKVVGCCVEPKD